MSSVHQDVVVSPKRRLCLVGQDGGRAGGREDEEQGRVRAPDRPAPPHLRRGLQRDGRGGLEH